MSEQWRTVKPHGDVPSMRSCPAWCRHPTRPLVYMFGGYDGLQRMSDFYVFDMTDMHWTLISPAGEPPSPRYFHSCAFYNDTFWVFGGYNGALRRASPTTVGVASRS